MLYRYRRHIDFYRKKEKERYMQILRDKSKVLTIALTLTLMATMLIGLLPAADAAVFEYPSKDTYAYITASPNPCGVGQDALVIFWLTEPLPYDPLGWENMEVTVRKPDGTTANLGKRKTESTGSTFMKFTPDAVGTYYFKVSFPGMWLNYTIIPMFGPPVDESHRYYKPSESKEFALVVQEEEIKHLPTVPLPTDYWTRPIYGENFNWYPIGGNFLSTAGFTLGNVVEGTSGPESAHVNWIREIDFGGIVGGIAERGYYSGLSYQRKFASPVIINGRLYYARPTPNTYGWYCVDLHTGEEYFYKNTSLASSFFGGMFGQVLRWDTPNQHGNIPYIWYTVTNFMTGMVTYQMYDAFTGEWICNIVNVPSGTMIRGPNG